MGKSEFCSYLKNIVKGRWDAREKEFQGYPCHILNQFFVSKRLFSVEIKGSNAAERDPVLGKSAEQLQVVVVPLVTSTVQEIDTR